MRFSKATLLLLTFLTTPLVAENNSILSGAELQAWAEKNTRFIDTPALKQFIDEAPDLVLIDIRTFGEIRNLGGAIQAPQNVNIPRGWLEFRVQQAAPHPDTPIVVYCGAGYRSALAAETLQQMGYTDVRNYAEGFIGWKKHGLPIAP